MTKKPFEGTRLARYLERRVLVLKPKKTQGEIASEAGLLSVNFLTKLQQRSSKLALDRVPDLARAVGLRPRLSDASRA